MTAQKKQKLRTAGILVTVPERKARQFVSDVIVMDGPACLRASLMRFSGEKFSDV